MTVNAIEKQLQEYRLLKERQRLAEQLALKPFWERILPDKISSIIKRRQSTEKTETVEKDFEECLPEQSTNIDSLNKINTVSRRHQVKQATKVKETASKSVGNDVVENSFHDSLQWLIFGVKLALWVILYLLCLEFEIGAIFIIISAFYIIFSNLSNRQKKHWEPSAYSVFNPNCEAIDGTINPEQFEKEIRYGF